MMLVAIHVLPIVIDLTSFFKTKNPEIFWKIFFLDLVLYDLNYKVHV